MGISVGNPGRQSRSVATHRAGHARQYTTPKGVFHHGKHQVFSFVLIRAIRGESGPGVPALAFGFVLWARVLGAKVAHRTVTVA